MDVFVRLQYIHLVRRELNPKTAYHNQPPYHHGRVKLNTNEVKPERKGVQVVKAEKTYVKPLIKLNSCLISPPCSLLWSLAFCSSESAAFSLRVTCKEGVGVISVRFMSGVVRDWVRYGSSLMVG